ncbi:hypothetical protein LSG31_14080 [Fodinisporobacter ferrooxydans]|uniref:Uncharacterized protein n=1 Tax=Fodinisporobacter ferrooxydans TaxID=2901836 RepID=A0ABY4CEV8_9BACL|nr:hypothetical protein LSG31_14080 [Alicyclobacillaceae bacterium MYW30-H2]
MRNRADVSVFAEVGVQNAGGWKDLTMSSSTRKKQPKRKQLSPEQLSVLQNIIFLIGEFIFVTGSSIALVAALKVLKNKKASEQSNENPVSKTSP